VGGRTTLLA